MISEMGPEPSESLAKQKNVWSLGYSEGSDGQNEGASIAVAINLLTRDHETERYEAYTANADNLAFERTLILPAFKPWRVP